MRFVVTDSQSVS